MGKGPNMLLMVQNGGGRTPNTSQSAQPHRHTELIHMVVGEEVLPV